MNNTLSPIIIALDFSKPQQALEFAQQLGTHRCRVKVGKELFTRSGANLVETLVEQGFEVFLDLKFHDIPNTVAHACAAAAELGVWMIDVHAFGGRDMLLAAREAIEKFSPRPLLIAVSILTSLNENDLFALGLHGTLQDNVLRLARLTHASGLDGLVCSPHEIAPIRAALGQELQLVTPGIRPNLSVQDDQKRTMTPTQAVALGANYLVIGRPITQAADPLQALIDIEASLISA
ncbi:MAG: orotidine-5'-phosphate decarboxylase [Thiotrichaceae bacterium]|nr:orotidine-5'-phosphate decarboxylase [Thiotrichaceae bacterium]